MARIAVIGPGAIGGTVAAWLGQDPAHAIQLCARTPLGSLQVDTPDGPLAARPSVVTKPDEALPADWVLVTTKAYDAAGAAAWFGGLVGPQTRVAVLQNGVEHRERFAAWLSPERITPVMVDLPAERPAPGHIVQRGPGRMVVPAGKAGDDFVGLFAGTALAVHRRRALVPARTAMARAAPTPGLLRCRRPRWLPRRCT